MALAVGLFMAGWHAQSIWDGYIEKKEMTKELAAAREGEVKIIKFNSDYSREKANVKNDNCIDAAVPDNLRMLIAK